MKKKTHKETKTSISETEKKKKKTTFVFITFLRAPQNALMKYDFLCDE